MDFFALALLFLTISTTAGAINFITRILRLRAPGMAVSRMPLLFYTTLTISVSVVTSLPALTAALVFLELDRQWIVFSALLLKALWIAGLATLGCLIVMAAWLWPEPERVPA